MRHRASGFVLDDKNRVLLFHRFKDGKEYYTVPGGGVEPGETPEQAAVRELKEETGLVITLGKKIGEFDADGNRQYFYVATSWSGTPTVGGEELAKQSPTNIYRLEWVPAGNLDHVDLHDGARDILRKYLDQISG
jgi:8-oxo-dGTP pyrophosphatase MutT (NUDIX family)